MAQRNRVEALDRIHVPSVDGRAVPLRALADPGMETGPARIERHDRERSVTLTAYVGAGHLTGAVTQAALDRVRGAVRLPADRKSTRLTPVTNAHLVCRLLLEKKKKLKTEMLTITHKTTTKVDITQRRQNKAQQ